MNALTSTITHVQSAPKWSKPHYEQPMLVKFRDLKPLGAIGKYRWYTLARFDGELCERPERLNDRDVIPNAVVAQHDDSERSYSVFDAFAPGSFAMYEKAPPRIGKPAPRPLRFRDALPVVYLRRARVQVPQRLSGGAGYIDARDRAPLVIPPRVRVVGGPAWLAYFAQRGTVLTPTDDRHLAVQSRRKLTSGDVALIAKTEPLTLPALRGESPECNSGPHTSGQVTTAITIGATGNLICRDHLAERVP